MNEKQIEMAPHIWSKDALLAKSQRYVEAMLEYDRDDWRFGLASSFVLEFVARATLAQNSPALLAEVKDWNNIYFALGFEPKASRFVPKSIDITAVVSRIKEILPTFTEELAGFALRHMNRRNGELHSGQAVFDGLHSSEWLPTFYLTCQTLLEAMGNDLEWLFGAEEAAVAGTLITAAKDEAAKYRKRSRHIGLCGKAKLNRNENYWQTKLQIGLTVNKAIGSSAQHVDQLHFCQDRRLRRQNGF